MEGRTSALVNALSYLLRPDQVSVFEKAVAIPRGLEFSEAVGFSRAELSFLLNVVLFCQLLDRVPYALTYVQAKIARGERVVLDHGALRTVGDIDGLPLPAGREAVARFLVPLGYFEAAVYPLERLGMTGYAYRHLDYPEDVPQFFVSELHPARFSSAFQSSVEGLHLNALDPLMPGTEDLLSTISTESKVGTVAAANLIRSISKCFSRHTPLPDWPTYQKLKSESPEMAWISTEGQAFNHATSRVADVYAEAEFVRSLGLPVKEKVEVSTSGRVRQTALVANDVPYVFKNGDVSEVLSVPGSFFEFIARDQLPEQDAQGALLDLGFDSSNAQGIFKMTGRQQQ